MDASDHGQLVTHEYGVLHHRLCYSLCQPSIFVTAVVLPVHWKHDSVKLAIRRNGYKCFEACCGLYSPLQTLQMIKLEVECLVQKRPELMFGRSFLWHIFLSEIDPDVHVANDQEVQSS